MRRRHVPQRMCVACRQTREKRDLVRVVRSADDAVTVDETGRLPGRGAYLCRSWGCWERALDDRRLDRALRISLNQEREQALRDYGHERFGNMS
jgi:predicted RNA-binding protein YlxR (DUF448 family)